LILRRESGWDDGRCGGVVWLADRGSARELTTLHRASAHFDFAHISPRDEGNNSRIYTISISPTWADTSPVLSGPEVPIRVATRLAGA